MKEYIFVTSCNTSEDGSTIALCCPWPVTVVCHWVKVETRAAQHWICVPLVSNIFQNVNNFLSAHTWAHLINPLQFAGSGYKPSSIEQSTTLDPPQTVVEGGGGADVVVGGDDVGLIPLPPVLSEQPPSLFVPMSI